ncbi:hypothetical protein Q3G72_000932 [Acer saccharum]|nr:hypothetical protein Q3G72_000932 [Acer saccharum]
MCVNVASNSGLDNASFLDFVISCSSQMGVEEYLGVCEIDSTDEGTLCLDFEIDSCFGMSSPSRKAYRRQLAEIFNVNRSRILAFKNKPPTPVELILQSHSKPTCSPLLHHSTDALFLRNLRKYFYLRDPWDPSDDATSELVTVDDELVTSVSWAPDGHHIAVGWNILKYKYGIPLLIGRLRTLKGGHRSGGNNHILTTGGWRNILLLSRLLFGVLFWGNLLATGEGSVAGCIKFWNTHTGACLNSIDTGSQVSALLWNKNQRELLSSHGFPHNQLTLWKYPSMVKATKLTGHTSRVRFMAQSPDGCTVASAAAGNTLRILNSMGILKWLNLLRKRPVSHLLTSIVSDD